MIFSKVLLLSWNFDHNSKTVQGSSTQNFRNLGPAFKINPEQRLIFSSSFSNLLATVFVKFITVRILGIRYKSFIIHSRLNNERINQISVQCEHWITPDKSKTECVSLGPVQQSCYPTLSFWQHRFKSLLHLNQSELNLQILTTY